MQLVFNRKELKYIIDKPTFHALMSALPQFAEPDKYSKAGKPYPIYSIYLDTPDRSIARMSFDKHLAYRYKLRLRSYYDFKKPNELVFVEIKKKVNGTSNKRRTQMTYSEALDFVRTGHPPAPTPRTNPQVINELKVLFDRLPLRPTTHVSYTRYAWAGDNDLRVTFDQDLTIRELDRGQPYRLLEKNKYILEIKSHRAIPLELARLLSDLQLYQHSFSKYSNSYLVSLKNQINQGAK